MPSTASLIISDEVSTLWWDAAQSRLLALDDTHDALLAVATDALTQIAKLPRSTTLGSLVTLSDGRILIASNGYGINGTVFVVDGSDVASLSALDRNRRRTSLAVAPDDTVYVGYTSNTIAGIALLDVSRGEEMDLVESGLVGPAGTAATSSALFVSDPHRGALVTLARRDPTATADVTNELPDPGAVLVLPSNDLVVASRADGVLRVTPAGGPIVVAHGFEQVRAIAYAPATARLFVAEHHPLGTTEVHTMVLE